MWRMVRWRTSLPMWMSTKGPTTSAHQWPTSSNRQTVSSTLARRCDERGVYMGFADCGDGSALPLKHMHSFGYQILSFLDDYDRVLHVLQRVPLLPLLGCGYWTAPKWFGGASGHPVGRMSFSRAIALEIHMCFSVWTLSGYAHTLG
jgi:hypothetical protein